MKYLKLGVQGKEVVQWQYFLRGLDLYLGVALGDFDQDTHDATVSFQKKYVVPITNNKKDIDGIVGTNSYAVAGTMGFALVKSESEERFGPNWPLQPDNIKPLSFTQREKLFGHIEYISAPVKGNPEAIKITNNWQKENLTKVTIPQLSKVTGAPGSGSIFWHKAGVQQIIDLFNHWEKERLTKLILTWAGSWAPRKVRGGNSLSNHANAVAFDINAAWNGLGREPAKVGAKGSVRELVEIATEHGFYWGGWGWNTGRKDGMHFELCKIL